MQKNRTKQLVALCRNADYKIFLSVVAFLRLLQKLLSLVQLGIHQLLLQVFLLHHFVYVLGWIHKCLLESLKNVI